jgi:hypothetical protein
MNPNDGWSSRLVVRLGVIVLFFLVLTSHASGEWKEKVLYSFQGGAEAGSVPAGGVVFDKQGNLYGVTSDGGGVYQLKPPAKKGEGWTESVLYVFKGSTDGDGATPEGGLIIDSLGNLYGTTAYGGTGNCVLLGISVGCGTAYELSPPATKGGSWNETILYSFPTNKNGYYPWGDLVFDGAGNLYGATQFGGGKGYNNCNKYYGYCGTVFELRPPKTRGGEWTEKVLHNFASGTDGANPNGGLIFDSNGNLYGTTYGGGDESGECGSGGCGTAFELQPPTEKGGAWPEKLLYRFHGLDGANPAAGLVFGGRVNLYGTASAGATGGNGALFELVAPTKGGLPWKESVLYHFSNGDGGTSPEGALTFDAGGYLCGTAFGGESHMGVVFRLKPPKSGQLLPLTVLYNFTGPPDGSEPKAKLISDGLGNLYSTTQYGGTGTCQGGCGTVFRISP